MTDTGSTTHFASSGDPVLDRRYGWAEAALKGGDAQAAVEILDQTLAQAYHWTEADILALSPRRRQAYLELCAP